MAGNGPFPLGFLMETEKETDFPASVEVIESEEPEKLAVTVEGFLGKSPSSWACRAALTSLFLHAKSSLVVTDLPSKNLKGLGSLEFVVDGNVVGTLHVAWRSSNIGAARTALYKSEKTTECFILGWLVVFYTLCAQVSVSASVLTFYMLILLSTNTPHVSGII